MRDRNIKDLVSLLSGSRYTDEIFIIPCSVDAVSIANRTIDVTPIVGKSDTPISGVRLMAEVEDGLLIVPVLNSTVFIAFSRTTPAFVTQFSAIDYVIWYVGSSSIEILNNGQINFNGGKNGGLVNVNALVSKINALENLCNDLVTKFNSHTHVLTLSTGTGTAAPTTAQESTTINPVTQKSDLEDKNVNH